jgi:hypothetical protein
MAIRSESIMDDTITDEELAEHLTEMLDRVRLSGERLMTDRVGEPSPPC